MLDATRDQRDPQAPAGLGGGPRTFARDLHVGLRREHLDCEDDTDPLDPESAFEAMAASAKTHQAWCDGGCAGRRPPGRLRSRGP